MEFPRLVYKSASEHTLAEDQDQYDSLVKDGWFGSVPEAKAKKQDIAAKDPAPQDPAPQDPAPQDPAPQDPAPQDPAPQDPAPQDPPTRAEMETQATTLGLKFTKKTTDADLLQLITDNLGA